MLQTNPTRQITGDIHVNPDSYNTCINKQTKKCLDYHNMDDTSKSFPVRNMSSCGGLHCFKYECYWKEPTILKHHEFVSTIQYLTICFWNYGVEQWPQLVFFLNSILMSQWNWTLGYKISSLYNFWVEMFEINETIPVKWRFNNNEIIRGWLLELWTKTYFVRSHWHQIWPLKTNRFII